MKKFLCLATVVACFASFSLSAQAQSAGSVAVIDISRIFKEHQRFRAALTDMKKDVEAFVKQKGEKQVLSAVQPSKGKTVSESLDARWQMDLAFGVASEGYTAYLVAVNVFDRFTWALPLKSKEPTRVAEALEKLLQSSP